MQKTKEGFNEEKRKVVAGMLTFAMFGMSLSSFSPTQVCAADDWEK
ncbi:MAG: hypothetical protein ACLTCI_02435 [[Clostridium] nexile]